MINILADNALLLGYSKGESKISPAMIKSCYQDLRLGPSEDKAGEGKKGSRQEARFGEGIFGPWWKWVAAVLLIAGILAFVAIRFGDQILWRFVTASVEPSKPKAEMVRAKAPVMESKPEKAAAPAAVPSAPEKQPAVVEEVEIELEVKQARLSEPALERPSPSEVRAGPSEIRAEPAEQTLVVERGDTLGKLSIKVYGRSNERVLGIIQKNNPVIRDPDLILPGQKLIFPPLPNS
jgi:hypothetical protein